MGEVVFNTSMTGCQEILTDPSYVGQIVTMAASQMGNVGTTAGDQESVAPHAVGGVVRETTADFSRWRRGGGSPSRRPRATEARPAG